MPFSIPVENRPVLTYRVTLMSLTSCELQPDMTPIVAAFWHAPDDALFSQKTLAAVTGFTEAWCERSRWAGEGPPFIKLNRTVRYRKREITAWINSAARGRTRTQA